MMRNVSTITGRFGTLSVEQEFEEVYTYSPQPDPTWRYTDQAGHEHHYQDGSHPTLVSVPDEPWWCEDCHELHEESHLECPQCGERIIPGSYIDSSPQIELTGRQHRLNGELITEEQARQWLSREAAE